MDDFIRPVKPVNKKPKKKGFIKEILIIILIVVCLAIGFITGYLSKKTTTSSTTSKNSNVIDEVYETLNDHWVNAGDEDVDIIHDGLTAFVSGLGDIHSSFWDSKQASSFNETVSGNVQGIGINYSRVSSGIMVTRVIDNTPAQESGLQVGDILTKADDHSLANIKEDNIKEYVRGDVGTTVKLTIVRDNKEMVVDVVRKSFDSSVSYEIRDNNGAKFGYISISTFGTDTGNKVGAALKEFKEQGVASLVLDLRNNGGGYLTAAVDILDYFFDSNDVIYQMQEKDSAAKKTYAKSDEKYTFTNGYILVNGNTASASELTAGTLQSELGYKLIGTTTYGKGTAQTQKVLSDGSVLKYTYAKWMIPNGTCINGVGLTPDIEVENVSLDNISIKEVKTPLKVDCVNTRVKSMQKMLNILGYNCDRDDGYFSAASFSALQKFESDNGLEVNDSYDETDKLMLVSRVMININNHENDTQYNKLLEILK